MAADHEFERLRIKLPGHNGAISKGGMAGAEERRSAGYPKTGAIPAARVIQEALDGDVTATRLAEEIDINRVTLYKLLKEHRPC